MYTHDDINIFVYIYRGFLKWWYPTTMGFPTKNDHFGVFWGYHHLRKHPYMLYICYIYFIYIYIYLLCVYIYIYVHIHIYIYVHNHIHTHTYVCVCVSSPRAPATVAHSVQFRSSIEDSSCCRFSELFHRADWEEFPWGSGVETDPFEPRKKNPTLLSIESWLVNRDPYNGLF